MCVCVFANIFVHLFSARSLPLFCTLFFFFSAFSFSLLSFAFPIATYFEPRPEEEEPNKKNTPTRSRKKIKAEKEEERKPHVPGVCSALFCFVLFSLLLWSELLSWRPGSFLVPPSPGAPPPPLASLLPGDSTSLDLECLHQAETLCKLAASSPLPSPLSI